MSFFGRYHHGELERKSKFNVTKPGNTIIKATKQHMHSTFATRHSAMPYMQFYQPTAYNHRFLKIYTILRISAPKTLKPMPRLATTASETLRNPIANKFVAQSTNQTPSCEVPFLTTLVRVSLFENFPRTHTTLGPQPPLPRTNHIADQ
jgi:hypothetical protein